MLEPGQQRLLGQTGGAGIQADSIQAIADRIGRSRAAAEDAPTVGIDRRRVAAQAIAAGDDQLGHAVAELAGEGQQLGAYQRQVQRQPEALHTVGQALQMAIE
ncbi:hypothetical protein D9M71_689770 [compost metagenome]